jgi:aspartyl-tRNA(Asn)/glutamyl-tRNA(Gln) amidotransferase subunit A
VLAEALRSGAVSPVDLTRAQLRRIDETEPMIKAYSCVCAESAIAEAERAEQELQAGEDKGPLHGLPIAVKDLIDTRGIPTTYGSPIYADHVPSEDATVVSRLRAAGAIVIGKANTHEFALGATTPPTRNPFDVSRIPGGSSGGSAAAVAAGSALIALGTDTGGSIRIPASYCGVVGLKPTYGLVSRVGVFPESWSLDHVGTITRRVEDAAVLLNAIAGHDPKDATTSPDDRVDHTVGIDEGLDGLTIGVPSNHFYDDLLPDVAAAVESALVHLEACGAQVRPIDFPSVDEILAAHAAIDLAEIATNHRRTYLQHSDSYLPETKPFIETGFFVRATTYIDALRSRPALLRRVLDAMAGVDVIVTPSQPIVAPTVGTEMVHVGDVEEEVLWAMVRLLAPFNLTGQPALSVCCGYSDGCPIGLQIIGRPYDDRTVLRVGHAYQTTTAWLEPLLDGSVPKANLRMGS